MIHLYEAIAKEFPRQTAQYLQSVYSEVLTNHCELSLVFSFLCMLERGGGYLLNHIQYSEFYSNLLVHILSNPSNDALLIIESLLVVKNCYHLFSACEHTQIIQSSVELLSHSSIPVVLETLL